MSAHAELIARVDDHALRAIGAHERAYARAAAARERHQSVRASGADETDLAHARSELVMALAMALAAEAAVLEAEDARLVARS